MRNKTKNICTINRNALCQTSLRTASNNDITYCKLNLWSQTSLVSLVANGSVNCSNNMEFYNKKKQGIKLKKVVYIVKTERKTIHHLQFYNFSRSRFIAL